MVDEFLALENHFPMSISSNSHVPSQQGHIPKSK